MLSFVFMSANVNLEQFCILARGQKNLACVSIIEKAIKHKNVFVFAELLEVPTIQALRSTPEFTKAFDTLELFAYGTYSDYKSNDQ